MNEQECLAKMVAPGTRRKGKYREGVIQIHVTRACDNACFNCTQGSNLGGKTEFITLDNFEKAVLSLKGYFGVVGVFGGNPALHPQFPALCEILSKHIPFEQRGLWCNHPRGRGREMRAAFNPAVSNLNVHLSLEAWDEFKRDWPESQPCGLNTDSRHSPCYVAMKDVLKKPCPVCDSPQTTPGRLPAGAYSAATVPCYECNASGQVYDIDRAHDLISNCDINQHWSAMIGQFRGEVRAWFCEIAGAQAMLHQYETDYPDTGVDPTQLHQKTHTGAGLQWWECGMHYFAPQVRKHCHECSVPLRGQGELAMTDHSDAVEQVSTTHQGIYKPKRKGRRVELVTVESQLGRKLGSTVNYLGNAKK